MTELPPKKTSTIGSRLPVDLRARLDAIIARHGTSDSLILENLLSAFCESVEEADAVRWPAVVLLSQKQLLVAEEADNYPTAAGAKKPPPDKSKRYRGDGPHRKVS